MAVRGLVPAEPQVGAFVAAPWAPACSGSIGLEGIDALAASVDAQNATANQAAAIIAAAGGALRGDWEGILTVWSADGGWYPGPDLPVLGQRITLMTGDSDRFFDENVQFRPHVTVTTQGPVK